MKKMPIIKWICTCLLAFQLTQVLSQTTYWVTSTNDQVSPVAGELRYAIQQANLATGPTTIRFNISGTGQKVISLLATLPVLIKPTIIDGSDQVGTAFGNPMIIIDGTNGGSMLTTCLKVSSANSCEFKALGIRKFLEGVVIEFSSGSKVTNCVINEVDNKCIVLHCSSYCIVKGNFVNTDAAGTNFAIDAEEGIFFTNNNTVGSTNNTIGSTVCEERNTIAYTTSEGIDNNPTPGSTPSLNINNKFSGNIIHSNTWDAIELRSGANGNIASPTVSTTGCTTSGTAVANCTIELFGSTSLGDKKNANVYLGTTTSNGSGNWSMALGSIEYSRITATATNASGNTSKLATSVAITTNTHSFTFPGGTLCFGTEITLTNTSSACSGTTYLWDFGDGTPLSSSPSHYFANTGSFIVTLYASGTCPMRKVTNTVRIDDCTPCTNCIGSFAPDDGKDYVISAWVKKETSSPTDLTYTHPQIYLDFPSMSSAGPFTASGDIIDGWQKIESVFTVPLGASAITVRLNCVSGANCLFDDIRIFPVDGSMKSYVYDPVTMMLMAELDERNYATFYEYDEEGKLMRVKKETEKGIMTVKEHKNNTKKK